MEITFSDFYCTKCGQKAMTLPRKRGKGKEAGHLKKLYCPHCQDTQHNCVEIKELSQHYDLDTFKLEFKNGNFDEEGNRKEDWQVFVKHCKQPVIAPQND